VFGAKKVKILTTIPKGYSRNLFEDFTTGEELDELEEFLTAEREACGWLPRITIADWMKIGAGHAILIEPDGRAVASPVWQELDCIAPFGNLHEQTANQLWEAYPYKRGAPGQVPGAHHDGGRLHLQEPRQHSMIGC
jgi:MoaA/NifB/PqqE/SkfB family radical SAM enzyme